MKIRYLTVARGKAIHIENYPNFHKSGSVAGMKKQYYGENALLVRCGSYIYNLTTKPDIYYSAR